MLYSISALFALAVRNGGGLNYVTVARWRPLMLLASIIPRLPSDLSSSPEHHISDRDDDLMEIPGYHSHDMITEIPGYSSASDHHDSMDDPLPRRPMRVGNGHSPSLGSPTRPITGDRMLRKGPFVYRE